jgi:hypothetical protein
VNARALLQSPRAKVQAKNPKVAARRFNICFLAGEMRHRLQKSQAFALRAKPWNFGLTYKPSNRFHQTKYFAETSICPGNLSISGGLGSIFRLLVAEGGSRTHLVKGIMAA